MAHGGDQGEAVLSNAVGKGGYRVRSAQPHGPRVGCRRRIGSGGGSGPGQGIGFGSAQSIGPWPKTRY